MNRQQAIVLVLVCGALVACRENQVVDPNLPPNAEAKLVGDDDELVDSLQLEYDGSPVTIELDGSGSSDDDGSIVEYRWLSGSRDDPALDPDDKEKTSVELIDEGEYFFTLWVADNDGAHSTPSTVSVVFGTPPADDSGGEGDGGTAGGGECTPFEGLSDSCKECTCEMCPTETSECDETCWGLINCVATLCGGDGTDTACIVPMCADFLAAATPATAAGPCAEACTAECSM